MPKALLLQAEPRKTPQQRRSVATVEAIYSATIQVLLKDGPDRLTTVRVAQRAGVSVGTLYQYFPHKQALLFALLERHLETATNAVEEACAQNHFQPLELMVHELVYSFINAKLADCEAAVALYRIASQPGGSLIVDRIRKRYETAMLAMFQTARLPPTTNLRYMTHMIFLTMSGTIRGHLESKASARSTNLLKEHLTKLVFAYCYAVGSFTPQYLAPKALIHRPRLRSVP